MPAHTKYRAGVHLCMHGCLQSWGVAVRAWVLAFIQSHKLAQFMPMQKPYKCYGEGKGLHSFQPCCEGGHPPCVCFSAGGAPKTRKVIRGNSEHLQYNRLPKQNYRAFGYGNIFPGRCMCWLNNELLLSFRMHTQTEKKIKCLPRQ